MKNIYLSVLCLFFLATSVQAQQEPLFAQYNTNAYLINPASAGSRGNHSINAFYRWQWVSFPGAPKTFGVTYQGLVGDLHGIGALVFSDVTGPTSRWGAKLSYAFHIPLADRKMRLSIGVAGRFARNMVRTNAITLIEENDNALTNVSGGVSSGDAEFGLYLYAKNFYVGFSAPNLIQTRLNFGGTTAQRDPIGHGYRHYFLTGGYRFNFESKKMYLEPSIMVKYVQGAQVQIDGGMTLGFLEDQLSLGVFYRSPSFLSFQCKFVFDQKLNILLAFDASVGPFQQYSVGATETMLGYNFPTRNMFQVEEDQPEDKGEL